MTHSITTIAFAATVAVASPAVSAAQAAPPLTATDRAALFAAAGFKQKGGQWIRCEEETPTVSYMAGRIDVVDLDHDGRPEAWVTEGSTYCYGAAGQVTALVTKDASGTWRKVLDEVGVAAALTTTHLGWPDIQVGGPGFATTPPHRWNGTTYVQAK